MRSPVSRLVCLLKRMEDGLTASLDSGSPVWRTDLRCRNTRHAMAFSKATVGSRRTLSLRCKDSARFAMLRIVVVLTAITGHQRFMKEWRKQLTSNKPALLEEERWQSVNQPFLA
jgi:hypothetical protein